MDKTNGILGGHTTLARERGMRDASNSAGKREPKNTHYAMGYDEVVAVLTERRTAKEARQRSAGTPGWTGMENHPDAPPEAPEPALAVPEPLAAKPQPPERLTPVPDPFKGRDDDEDAFDMEDD